jgi:hypothetical protein
MQRLMFHVRLSVRLVSLALATSCFAAGAQAAKMTGDAAVTCAGLV